MNIVATNLFASKYYPTPINSQTTNNAINTLTQAYNTDQGDVKVDYTITPNDRFEGRYSQAIPERSRQATRCWSWVTALRKLRSTTWLERGPTPSAQIS